MKIWHMARREQEGKAKVGGALVRKCGIEKRKRSPRPACCLNQFSLGHYACCNWTNGFAMPSPVPPEAKPTPRLVYQGPWWQAHSGCVRATFHEDEIYTL